MAQGCSLSPILISVLIKNLGYSLVVVRMLFANDILGVSDSRESLQKLYIDIVVSGD